MDFEENSVQRRLLNDFSPVNMKVFYELLNHLRAKNFRSFKNTLHYYKKQSIVNLDYVNPDGSEETCLDIASKYGLTEFVKLLLDGGAKPNRINKVHNRAPIHFATEGGHIDSLAALLAEPTINPNLEAGQQTALHIAVRRNDLTCAGLLLEKSASASIPNSKGLTALHLAAMKGRRDMVELILEKSRQCPDIDTYKDYNGQTTREVIQQKLPDLSLGLPPKDENREVNAHDLKYYLTANDEKNFLKNMELVKIEVLHSVAEELLERAAEFNFHKTVIGILEKLTGRSFNVKPAAEAAILQSNSAILRELLHVEPMIANDNDLILSACQQLGIPKSQRVNMSDRLECLKLILEHENVDVHCTDNKGNTPLHYAANAGCAEAMTLLLKRGSCIGHMNEFNIPPIADIPACVLSRYFDDCLQIVQIRRIRTNEYVIEFDYRCLMPHDVLKKYDSTREIKVFKYIASNNGLKHLLKHPLLSSFLYLKWHRIRHVLYANFILYAVFYVLLNIYILSITYNNPLNENRTQIANNNFNMTLENSGTFWKIVCNLDSFLWIFITPLWLFFTFWDIFKLISCPWRYLTNSNLLDALLFGLTFALICDVSLQVGPILILLSAWKLVTLISQHRDMSTGFEIFRTISINYVRLLFPYIFLIGAFVLAFHTLFKDNANFSDLMHSSFKTIIMLTGEFDSNDIPFASHPIWSHIVFVLFVFFIVIVLLNLLNGLAVSDTAEILNKAELNKLISWIRVVANIEDLAIDKPFKHCFCCKNSGLLRWNPFSFLAKKIFLFPRYLIDGKVNVKLYDSIKNNKYYEFVSKKYVRSESVNPNKYWTTLRMDPNIIKQAKEIILNKNQLPDNEKIMMELTRLREKLAAIEVALAAVRDAKFIDIYRYYRQEPTVDSYRQGEKSIDNYRKFSRARNFSQSDKFSEISRISQKIFQK